MLRFTHYPLPAAAGADNAEVLLFDLA